MDHSASSTRRDTQGSRSQAGSTLRRASQASLANGSRRPGWLHAPACEDSKPGNFSTQHGAGRVQKRGERERERTRKFGESGWLHAPACEPRHSSTELLSKPWLHAPACEDSQPGSNFSTQHGAGRVERRQVPKCRWLHALACEHSQPGNSFQEEWTIQPAAQEETDKDPKARLARSGVRAKPAWQMDPEGRDGCTLRRAKTASQATTSQHNTALAGLKNVERDNKKTWRVRLAPRPSVPTKALFHRVTVKAVAPCSGVRTQPARQQLLNTTRRWQG